MQMGFYILGEVRSQGKIDILQLLIVLVKLGYYYWVFFSVVIWLMI